MAEVAVPAPRLRVRRTRSWPITLSLLSAPLLWLLLFFLLPIGIVSAHSVGAVKLFPTDHGVGLDAWRHFFAGGSIYLGLFWKSIRMSFPSPAVEFTSPLPIW